MATQTDPWANFGGSAPPPTGQATPGGGGDEYTPTPGPNYDAIAAGSYPAMMVSAERQKSTFNATREFLKVHFLVLVPGESKPVPLDGNASPKRFNGWLATLGITSTVRLSAMNLRCLAGVQKVNGRNGPLTVVKEVYPAPAGGR